LLSSRLLATPNAEVVSVDLARLRLPEPSSTFHGRDLFAPIAARLSSGQHSLVDFGSTVTPRAAEQRAVVSGSGSISGEVVVVDRFGNLLSNIELGADTQVDHVSIGSRVIPFGRTYADAEAGRLIAIVNSFGVVEVAERNGNAEQRIRAERGTPLIVHLKPLPDR
jgi:S-adenosylmethionine hydrolase